MRWQHLERVLWAGLSGVRLLDVGCGPAPPVGDLPVRGVRYVGVDRVGSVTRRARRHLAGLPPPAATVVRADVTALPFASGSFDVVTAAAVLGLLDPARRRAALREMARVCRGEIRVLEPLVRPDARTPGLATRLVAWAPHGPLAADDFAAAGLEARVRGPAPVAGVYSYARVLPLRDDLRP